uniref:Uncharacterized protein n=1 Tax=Trypanosoma congolense (strain IL3000) TaxID=1068625 RepID=G0ULC5_TRYCI|nr:conserved hypothetical protein [Trypanosoma congolense IL3000]
MLRASELSSYIPLVPINVFQSFNSAVPTLREVSEKSGVQRRLIEDAVRQLQGAETGNNSFTTHIQPTTVRLYTPPPIEADTPNIMLLFRGAKDITIEGYICAESPKFVYFSSSLFLSLPYGVLSEGEKYRVTLCRVTRRSNSRLFNKLEAPEKELALFDSLHGNLEEFNATLVKKHSSEASGNGSIYDGVVDWLDGAVSYCFFTKYVQCHTILSADTLWCQ